MQNTKSIPLCPYCFTLKENREKFYGNITDNSVLAEKIKKLDYCAQCVISCMRNHFCPDGSSLTHKTIYEMLANEFKNSVISGILKIKKEKPCMVYLKIDDSVLRRIYARFAEMRHINTNRAEIQLPPYYPDAPSPFPNPIGAHVTIIGSYEFSQNPELLNNIPESHNNRPFSLSFKEFKKIIPVGWKQMEKVWVMTFACPEMQTFRSELGLPQQFKDHELHATFAVLSRIGLQSDLHLGTPSNSFFHLELSRLLNDANSHVDAIAWLFFQIAAKYNLSTDKLNPLSRHDWIKLLARTMDAELIDLGCNFWKENLADQQSNGDLLLFHALTLTEPNLALHHFCDMHSSRKPLLTAQEYVTCLNLIIHAYEKQPLKIGLKRLIPILSDLIDKKKISENPTKKKYIAILKYVIKIFGIKDFRPEVLLKLIAEGFISPTLYSDWLGYLLFNNKTDLYSITETDLYSTTIYQKSLIVIGQYLLDKKDNRCFDLLDRLIEQKISPELPDIFHLFLVKCLKNLICKGFKDPKNFSRLNKLINIAPPSKDTTTAEILTEFFNHFLINNRKKIPESDLRAVEELMFIHKDLMYKLNNWIEHVHSYLNSTRPSRESSHLLMLFACVLQKNNNKFKEVNLLSVFAKLIAQFPAPSLPFPIQEFLKTRKVNPIDTFIKLNEFEIAKTYLHLYFDCKWPLKDPISLILQICFGLSQKKSDSLIIIKLLEMQDKKIWQKFFANSKNKEKDLNLITSILNRFFNDEDAQSNENLLKWISFLYTIYLENPLSFTKPFIPICSENKFKKVAIELLDQDASLLLRKHLFMKTEIRENISKIAVRKEIENQIKLKKNIDIKYCLDLMGSHFASDGTILISLIKCLQPHKDKEFIPNIIEAILSLKKFSEEEEIKCWMALFEYFNKALDPLMWEYLKQLPESFGLETHACARQQAKQILIMGAALELLKKKQTAKNNNVGYSAELLWNETKKLTFLTPDTYLNVFSLLDENLIEPHLEEFLFLGLLNLTSISHQIKNSPFFPGLTINFPALINIFSTQEYFKKLIEVNDAKNKNLEFIENCLFFCFESRILNNTNNSAFAPVIKTILQTRYSNFSTTDISSFLNASRFINLFYFVCQSTGFNKIDNQEFYSLMITFINRIQVDLNLWENESTIETCALNKIIEVGFQTLLPSNCEEFEDGYFETVFKWITELDSENNCKWTLISEAITRIITILQEKEEKNLKGLNKTKLMFEKAVDWIINAVYSLPMPMPKTEDYILQEVVKPLKIALNLNIYQRDTWAFNRTILLEENEYHLDNLINEEKPAVYKDILMKLIEIRTEKALSRAWDLFFQFVNLDYKIKSELRIHLFNELLKASTPNILFEIDEMPIIFYINSKFKSLLQDGKILANRNLGNYLYHASLNLFKANIECISKVKCIENIKEMEFYINFSLEILDYILKADLKEQTAEVHLNVEKLIDPVIELVTLHIENEIENYSERKKRSYNSLINLILQNASHGITKHQFALLEQLIKKLIDIKVNSNHIDIKRNYVLMCLNGLALFSRALCISEFEPFFIKALNWLRTEKSSTGLIEYHLNGLEETENREFYFYTKKVSE